MKGKSENGAKLKDIKSSDLMGGNLARVAALCMLRNLDKRQKFTDIVKGEETAYASLQKNYEQVYGYKPANECLEWARVSKAYFKFQVDASSEWALDDGLKNFHKNTSYPIDQAINDWHFIVAILTGLELLGHDGGGDRCFLSTLPNPLMTTEVYRYDHELGEFEDCVGYSFAHFIASGWGSDELGEEEDSTEKAVDTSVLPRKTLHDFEKKAKKILKARPYYHDPVILFKRVRWLIGHMRGSTVYKFASKMADAPPYSLWEKEIALITKEPVLANYWMLAHYFLGNEKACRVTIAEAKKAPGDVSKKLAALIQKLLDDPTRAKLGKLRPLQLREIKEETKKNLLPELLEPENFASLTKISPVKKLPLAEYKKKIANEDPWKLIRDYPLDVDLHDAILKSVSKKNSNVREAIEGYFEARSRDAHNDWPRKITPEHKKLSIPVIAAFRSGLRYDSDHTKAFAGLTKTLGKFDDDLSIEAYAEAMRTLKPDDKRLDFVTDALSTSKHPKAKEIIRIGAWRFFDQFSDLVKSIKKTQAEGPTLNDMFKAHSYLHGALNFSLSCGDEESEKLAGKVLNFRSNLRALGVSIGLALRVAGIRKLEQYTAYAKWYCTATSELKIDDLEKSGCYNLAEAAIAYAKLAPKESKKILRKIFNKKYSSKFFMLDMKAGALAGLLLLEPKNHELHEWATRILGIRTDNMRVFGPLRAIAEGRIKELAPLAKPHVYGDPNPLDPYSLYVQEAARNAVASATGVTLPPFDETDEYASNVKKKNLPMAIKQPEKYITANVFERIIEVNLKHPDIVKNGVDYLIDMLRFSGDEPASSDDQGVWNAIKALTQQGAASLRGMAQVLELPHVKPDGMAIFYCQCV